MKEFVRGFGSINLFSEQRENDIDISKFALSNEEAFKKDREAIANDMWNAIEIIKKEHPEYNYMTTRDIEKPLSTQPAPLNRAQTQFLQYSSPYPPPEILEKYENIHPGLINHIIEVTKHQTEHRIELESRNLNAQIKHQKNRDFEAKLGQWFAFIISIVGISGAVFTALNGHEITASCLSVASLSSLAARFISGRSDIKK